MRKQTLVALVWLLWVVAACQNEDPSTPEGLPLTFSSATPTVKTSLSPLGFDNFKVWGAYTTDGGSQDIMPGYRVNYTVADGWTYTAGEGTDGQALRYWSAAATAYRFHAGAPATSVTDITASTLTLNVAATQDIESTCLYSEPRAVGITDFGKVVRMNFVYACAKVCIAFRYKADSDLAITGLRLTPPRNHATAGALTFGYDWQTGDEPAWTLAKTADTNGFDYPDMALPASAVAATQTSAPWYMVPDPTTTGLWTLTLNIGGEAKNTQFTIDKPWQPGRAYTYRFEYTDDARLVFTGSDDVLFIGEKPEDGGNHTFN